MVCFRSSLWHILLLLVRIQIENCTHFQHLQSSKIYIIKWLKHEKLIHFRISPSSSEAIVFQKWLPWEKWYHKYLTLAQLCFLKIFFLYISGPLLKSSGSQTTTVLASGWCRIFDISTLRSSRFLKITHRLHAPYTHPFYYYTMFRPGHSFLLMNIRITGDDNWKAHSVFTSSSTWLKTCTSTVSQRFQHLCNRLAQKLHFSGAHDLSTKWFDCLFRFYFISPLKQYFDYFCPTSRDFLLPLHLFMITGINPRW